MTKTVLISPFFDILNMFGILNFGHCDLIGICDLEFTACPSRMDFSKPEN